jgi:hypothetical protein
VGSGPDSVVAADMNGDGKVDLITAYSGNNTLTVLTNDSNGGFVLASSPSLGSFSGNIAAPIYVTAADANDDGKVDLICARNTLYAEQHSYWNGYIWVIYYVYYYNGTILVLTNNGSAVFTQVNSLQSTSGSYFGGVAMADVNGDGKVDLIAANYGAPSDTFNTLIVLTNMGNAHFVQAAQVNVGSYPHSVTAADVNGDGKVDLVCANSGANTLSVLLNTPTYNGNFNGVGSGLTGLNASQLTTGTVPLAQLPGVVVTNNASGVTLSNATLSGTFNGNGTFSGNGAGLTGVPGTFLWQHVTSISQQAQPNTGYIADSPFPVTITLPPTPNIGDIIRVSGVGGGGWKIGQNDGQSVLPAPFIGYYTNLNNLTNWNLVLSDDVGVYWKSIALSEDGSKWVAASVYGPIVNQSGGYNAFPSVGWSGIASSADGTKLVAAALGGGIFTSTNSGATATQTSAPDSWWSAVASSTNGTKLVAAASSNASYDPGSIYTSANSGSSWTKTSAPSNNWQAVASSADGAKLVAVSYENASLNPGSIYTSANSGSTWTKTSAPSNNWAAVASSADGTKLVAASDYNASGDPGSIYTSVNSGSTWTKTSAPSNNWGAVASSANGTILVAGASDYLYISTNSGTNWTQTSAPNNGWVSVASLANGNGLAAGDGNGNIYNALSLLPHTTTPGTVGYLYGYQYSAIELQYIGSGQWMPLSYVGDISAY